MSNQSFGKNGEDKAVKYLQSKGYRILGNNFHKASGEIDIVCFDPKYNEYVFVEVKTRKNTHFGYPEEFVDKEKINKIKTTAEFWFISNNIDDPEWRIDIIGIEWDKKEPSINHWENIS